MTFLEKPTYHSFRYLPGHALDTLAAFRCAVAEPEKVAAVEGVRPFGAQGLGL